MDEPSAVTNFAAPPIRVSIFSKLTLRLMMFLLRRKMMGSAGEQLMIITVTGRKTGRVYSTPIGFLRDGENLISLTNGDGSSNWYRNVLKNPEVTLNIKGQEYTARAEPVSDPAERQRIFEMYKRDREFNFESYFDAPLDAPDAELQQALAKRAFVRFPMGQEIE